MHSGINPTTEVQLAEHGMNVTEKGKETGIEDAFVPHDSHPAILKAMTESSDIAETSPTPITPTPEIPTTIVSPHISLPPHLTSEAPSLQRSRPSSRDASPYPRSRPSTPNRPSTPSSSSPKSVPPRRSRRTVARGADRPRGPPELEAALDIAIRNLESDIYEWWCANQKPGSPIPTTAFLKGRSPRIRRAAEAVDEADRLLNEAIYGKPRKSRTVKKTRPVSQQSSDSPDHAPPEAAFEQLELRSQESSPSRHAYVDVKRDRVDEPSGEPIHVRENPRDP